MLHSGFLSSINDILMLSRSSLNIERVGTDKEQILDSRKRLLQGLRIIEAGHSKGDTSVLKLLALRLARRRSSELRGWDVRSYVLKDF